RQERNWKAANRVSAEAIRRFKDLGLLNELSKYAQMAKNGVQLAGRVTGVIDVGIKLYNYLNIISDLNSSWTDVARGIADIEIAVAAVAEKPIAAAYGIADFLVERASGKNITSWAAAGVDNSLEGLNTAYDFYSGRVRKPKPSPDNHWKPQKPIDCPQNGEIGGKRRRKYWYYLSGGDSVEVIQSLDPNAIIGPEGVTPKKWVSVHDVLPYTILFENDKSATAPAKFVRINYPIDSKQDPATFTLGSFGFNNLTYTIPPNTPAYTQRLDARDSLGLYIDVTAGLDVINNQAFWEFNSIDPITLLPTNNPLSGFLLLQDSTKTNYGHGFVNFNIQPRRTDITLDTIHARADIIFDSNDTIPTNYHTNTVDAFAPTSSMIALPATSTNPVALSWTGVDDTNGSGVQSYTLYVSTNGVSFYALRSGITRTDTTITLAPDSTYCFFVLATDSVGNTETLRAGEIKCTMVGNNIVLPISWLYFNGTNRNTDNYLEWATGFEQNVKEFKLERSIPGGNFTTIATIPATGNSSTAQSYNYLDKRVHQLNSPTLLYRIKEIERDGKYTYSNIVRLMNSTKGKTNSIVYPNPTSGTITVVVGDKALIGTQARI
ncbi:MAG: DUF7619 domain-containing protein, partial [Ferruginibacter sp.]